jgi:5-formyltetrahydrofolate cyclo-ligase
MRARCRAVDPDTARRAGRAVAEHLAGTDEYRACRRLVAYAELAGELPVGAVVERARSDGKQVLWPRLAPEGRLEFAPVADPEELVADRRGVREPPRAAAGVALELDALLLVPGLAFDEAGGRLGRGGGVWDRTLAGLPGAFTCGVGYEFQIVASLPRESHDRAVAALVTERGVRRCGGR